MAFKLIRYSQQDLRWKNQKLGHSALSIGGFGCTLCSVAMLLNGHGLEETPETLNEKLKKRGGFLDAALVWSAVSSLGLQFKNIVLCRDTDAPLQAIRAAVQAGQPVLLEVDSSPSKGLQTHWVLAYEVREKDFLILDPYPLQDGAGVSLMQRYSQGKPLRNAISAAVWYEAASAAPQPVAPPPAEPGGWYARVVGGLDAPGLRLRSAPGLASQTLGFQPSGAFVRLLEEASLALPKVGVYDQWLRVRISAGQEGYMAAWYLEKVLQAAPAAAGDFVGEENPKPVTAEPAPPPAEIVPPAVTEPAPGGGETPAPASSAAGAENPLQPPSAPAPSPKKEKLVLKVLKSVGASGLRLRSQPSPAAPLVKVLPAGSSLRVLDEPALARPKIGRQDSWLWVRDRQNATGYVAAWLVELDKEKSELNDASLSFGVSDFTFPQTFVVHVSGLAKPYGGLRLRSLPDTTGKTLKILAVNTPLTALDENAPQRVGKFNRWIHVQEPLGQQGYVAAWLVEAE